MFRCLCCYLFCLPDKRIAGAFLRCGHGYVWQLIFRWAGTQIITALTRRILCHRYGWSRMMCLCRLCCDWRCCGCLCCLLNIGAARLLLWRRCWCARWRFSLDARIVCTLTRRIWRMVHLIGLLRRCTVGRIRRSAVNRMLTSAVRELHGFMYDLASRRLQLLGCCVFRAVCGFRLLCGVIQLVYEFLHHLALHNGWRGAPFGFGPCGIIFFSNVRYDVHLRNTSHGGIYFAPIRDEFCRKLFSKTSLTYFCSAHIIIVQGRQRRVSAEALK